MSVQLLQMTNVDKVFDNYITLPPINLYNRGVNYLLLFSKEVLCDSKKLLKCFALAFILLVIIY